MLEDDILFEEDLAVLDQVASSYFNSKTSNTANVKSPRLQSTNSKTPSSAKKVANIKGFENKFVLSKKNTQYNSNYFPSPFKSDRQTSPSPNKTPRDSSSSSLLKNSNQGLLRSNSPKNTNQFSNKNFDDSFQNDFEISNEEEFATEFPDFNISINNEFENLEIGEGGGKLEANGKVPSYDPETINTWIYPMNFPKREYQYRIAKEAITKNTLVCLPTGLGKTFIAAVVMYNYYRWFPEGKVIFMAPTKPLVAQQIDACKSIFGENIKEEETAEMTGNMNPKEREKMWTNCRVFFVTPHILANDLKKGTCPSNSIVCIVVDEAHKAQGNYAYCIAINLLYSISSSFRILALSASPGQDVKSVQSVINNLRISHLEIRSDSDSDVKPYIHDTELETIVIPLSTQIIQVKSLFLDSLKIPIEKLCNMNVFYERNPERISSYQLLLQRNKLRSENRFTDPAQKITIEGLFHMSISLLNAWKILNTHGLSSFQNSILNFHQEALAGTAKMRKEFVLRTPQWSQLLDLLPQVVNNNIDGDSSLSNNNGVNHPKLAKLEELVIDHFKNSDEDTRCMIFVHYRDSVNEIVEVLRKHHPLVKAMPFVGHATSQKVGNTSKGLTQKDQASVIKIFKQGGYNTLVATCIGEEGIDIGEVDLIICFDALASPTRMVQRFGRTGRKRNGRCVVLLSEGSEESVYKKSLAKKNKIYNTISFKHSSAFSLFPNSTGDMFPQYFSPDVVFSVFDQKPVNSSNSVNFPKSKKRKQNPIDNNNNNNNNNTTLTSTTNTSTTTSNGYLTREQYSIFAQRYEIPASASSSSLPSFNIRDITFRQRNKSTSTSTSTSTSNYNGIFTPVGQIGHSKRTISLINGIQACTSLTVEDFSNGGLDVSNSPPVSISPKRKLDDIEDFTPSAHVTHSSNQIFQNDVDFLDPIVDSTAEEVIHKSETPSPIEDENLQESTSTLDRDINNLSIAKEQINTKSLSTFRNNRSDLVKDSNLLDFENLLTDEYSVPFLKERCASKSIVIKKTSSIDFTIPPPPLFSVKKRIYPNSTSTSNSSTNPTIPVPLSSSSSSLPSSSSIPPPSSISSKIASVSNPPHNVLPKATSVDSSKQTTVSVPAPVPVSTLFKIPNAPVATKPPNKTTFILPHQSINNNLPNPILTSNNTTINTSLPTSNNNIISNASNAPKKTTSSINSFVQGKDDNANTNFSSLVNNPILAKYGNPLLKSPPKVTNNTNNTITNNTNITNNNINNINNVTNSNNNSPSKTKKHFIDYLNRSPPPNKGKKPLPVGKEGCLAGKVFLITGVLDSLEREEAAALITKYGGQIMKSVSKKLTHVVVGFDAGAKKLEKIQSFNSLIVLNEDSLFTLIQSSLPSNSTTARNPSSTTTTANPSTRSIQKEIKQNMVVCPICDSVFEDEQKLSIHFDKNHSTPPPPHQEEEDTLRELEKNTTPIKNLKRLRKGERIVNIQKSISPIPKKKKNNLQIRDFVEDEAEESTRIHSDGETDSGDDLRTFIASGSEEDEDEDDSENEGIGSQTQSFIVDDSIVEFEDESPDPKRSKAPKQIVSPGSMLSIYRRSLLSQDTSPLGFQKDVTAARPGRFKMAIAVPPLLPKNQKTGKLRKLSFQDQEEMDEEEQMKDEALEDNFTTDIPNFNLCSPSATPRFE